MIKLAWRNIWRNKRRTLITSASVFFGVILSVMMRSLQEGSYETYIRAIVNFYSGYLQIHQNGYWDDKTIHHAFESMKIDSLVSEIGGITNFTHRLESFALVSASETTKGVMVVGIMPQKEDQITRLSQKMIAGRYLIPQDSGILVGSALANYLHIDTKDTLVLLSQGYHGVSAAGKFPVRGILKHPSPPLDRSVVYLDLNSCQEFFSAEKRVTSTVIMIDSSIKLNPIKTGIQKKLDLTYEVMDWQEMNRILLKQIDSDRASGFFIIFILYMIIAFGIFGTILMMTLERKKEFGVLMAVGMQKKHVIQMVVLETFFIGFIGSFGGVMGSIPLLIFFLHHPITFTGQAAEAFLQMGFEPVMPVSFSPSIFLEQTLTVFLFSLIIGIYPITQIHRLKISNALKKPF